MVFRMEVKTPLTTLHTVYGSHVQTKKAAPFSSTDRFTKHIKELAESLKENQRALMLIVYQYEKTLQKEHHKSTRYEEVKYTLDRALRKGLEIWELNMRFTPEGVELISYQNITREE